MHRPAHVELTATGDRLAWRVDDGTDFSIDVDAVIEDAAACDVVAGTCLSAAVGLSADHHGKLEGARMVPDVHAARQARIDRLASRFIDSFATAQPAPSYVMQDVEVTWSPAAASTVAIRCAA